MKTRAFLAIAIAFSLAGCTADAPAPAETIVAPPTATATPEPEPVAESIIIGGLSFSIEFDDDSSVSFEYASDPDAAIAALTDAFGEVPTVTEPAEAHCNPSFVEHAWGDFSIRTDYAWLPDGQRFAVLADGPLSVAVTGTDGSALGDDNSELFEASRPELAQKFTVDGSEFSFVYFDVEEFAPGDDLFDGVDEREPWGGYSESVDGKIRAIGAPLLYAASANC
jgi:hypothetical protein